MEDNVHLTYIRLH